MDQPAGQRLWCREAPRGRLARILTLAGLEPQPLRKGTPAPGDALLCLNDAPQDIALAAAQGLELRHVSPAPLAADRHGPAGLLIAATGGAPHDPDQPSELEALLAGHPLDESHLLGRAREGMARIAAAQLSKYGDDDPGQPPPAPGYVLIVDQRRSSRSAARSGAGTGLFKEMLFRAQDDHPGRPLLIRPHPETLAGRADGFFDASDIRSGVTLLDRPVTPQALLAGAVAVYTISSQLGFEAIMAGHRPQVFGRPFYAGWGLSEDHGGPLPRRHRKLTRAQLFAGAMILAPRWHDPCRDALCSFETALDQIEAETRAHRDDRAGHVATGMRLWKRSALQGFFGAEQPLRFAEPPARAAELAQQQGRGLLVWAGQEPEGLEHRPLCRVEDGLIRSRGLGADLVAPLSLVLDDLGIYYDPTRPSRLETLIATPLRPGQIARAEALIARLIATGVTKYTLGGAAPAVPAGHRILVPGQVEDDASIRLGTHATRTNLALLERVRAENPDAVILWKPHPDVEAGLRPGAVPPERLAGLADVTLSGVDAAAALGLADAVWTMTSGLGFEALLRGIPVTCLGAPFYAGWGLTRDLGPVPDRRQARPGIAALAHAVLIAYPRYRDPITGRPCPVELVVERIAEGRVLPRSPLLRLLAAAQGALAGHAWLWRR